VRVQTITSQAWWIALADEIRPEGGLDAVATFAALKEKFGFPIIPTGPAQPGGGMDFVNGAMRSGVTSINIGKISVFGDGLSIEVPSTTENAEIVLQETLRVFYSFGVREPATPPLHYYLSTIVVDFEHSLNNLIPGQLLKQVEKAIPVEADAQFAGIYINADKTTLRGRLGPVNPTLFNIHRRLEIPYDVNRYFSQANMRTADHLELLAEFEQLAAKAM
jgi:hypothetical protein